jgi:RNA polymerase sigma factor (sigma-70 family)
MKIKEEEIVSFIQTGKDQEVIKHLYSEVFPKVKSSIRARKGNVEDASDVFQDAIMTFYNLAMTNNFSEKYTVYGFLYTTSMNRWLNILRKNKRLDLVEDFDTEKNIDDKEIGFETKPISDERKNLLHQFFSDLGANCLELLNYSIFQSISFEDIALRMNIVNGNSAKMQVFRCKQKLIQKIETNPSLRNKLRELV